MSNGVYIGSGETARKIAGIYVGVDGVARKVTKGYIGVSGLARQFYAASVPFTYSYNGDCTENEITIDGVAYTVLTITGSGTLTVNRAISVDVWLCGGGGNGRDAWISGLNGAAGGGGSGGYVTAAQLQLSGSVACAIGAATGLTSFGALQANGGSNASAPNGGSGESGGGAARSILGSVGTPGAGTGKSTTPTDFGQDSPHCAGGGGGGLYDANLDGGSITQGGIGGSNGENGGMASTAANPYGGVGGEKGGGDGGDASHSGGGGTNGRNATFYGSGGGGGSVWTLFSDSKGIGGSGYQGVIYIRWKKEDAA